MKKALIMIAFFAIIFIVQLQPAAAWSVPTHYEIVEKTYHALPLEVQSKLSLQRMYEGCEDPDLKFLDYPYHKYPANQANVDYWLNRGKIDYQNGDYNDASYSFGVASHYISDGCCAPHCVNNASHDYHFFYELRALVLEPKINYVDGDIHSIMLNYYEKGKDSWQGWISNKSDFYIQNDLDRSVSASYIAINESVS
jgi:hypothetical protein